MKLKRQRKVLQIITKSNFGGAQKYVLELSSEIKNNGLDITVALGGNGILKEKLQKAGIRTTTIKSLKKNINILSDLKVFFEIIKLIRKYKPDIIHLNSSKIGGIGGLAARICFVPKIIFTIHGLAFNENRSFLSKIIIKKIYFLTIILSHKSIAVSENVKKQILKIPFSFLFKNKIIVIKNSIKPVNFLSNEIAREFIFQKIKKNPDPKIKIIGTIAELHHIKGINFLIKSAKRLIDSNPNLFFVVFGDGEEKENLEKMIREFKLENNFFLLGFVDQASLYLKGLDLFVLPSLSEGLALAILEAKQANLKIVASRIGGIPEAVEDYPNACLFEVKNTEDLTEKIKQQLEKQKVEKLKNDQNDFGQMISKTFSLY